MTTTANTAATAAAPVLTEDELAAAEREMTERTVRAMEVFEETEPQVTSIRVLDTEQVTPGFMRITFGPDPLAPDGGAGHPFAFGGADQWFRLFVPAGGRHDGELHLPWGPSEGWFKRLGAMPEDVRPVCRNYTVRDFRQGADTRSGAAWEFDVDFVLHRNGAGELEGIAARWSTECVPGDRAGILGQSTMYDPEGEPGTVTILTDETGLPGVESIIRSRPAGSETTVLVTMAHRDDARPLECASACHDCFFCPKNPKVHVRWLERESGESWERALDAHLATHAPDYFYAVGSQPMVLDARKRAKAVGLTNEQIRFCAYWMPARVRG
ncbi:siderophore-interacting protein [Brevibacterium samyangense]|uniref:Siderophore-interacting protein n=1 Tax=Brevibacterium samyangense TaxID=366888 RepID=A0ABP5F491_9MICO